jgi:ferredoxin
MLMTLILRLSSAITAGTHEIPTTQTRIKMMKWDKNLFNRILFRWLFTTPKFENLFRDGPMPQEDKCTLCYQCKKICKSDGRKKSPVL